MTKRIDINSIVSIENWRKCHKYGIINCNIQMFVLIIIVSNCTIQMFVPIIIVSNCTIQIFVLIIIVSETIVDPNMVKCWCKKCQKLPSNDSLSRFCSKNYLLRPNAKFRPCFTLIWGLLPRDNLGPLTMKNPRLWGTKEYLKGGHFRRKKI